MEQQGVGVTRVMPQEDIAAFAKIYGNAYPGIGVVTPEDRERFGQYLAQQSGYADVELYGHYRADKLVGGMILYDFQMNWFGDGRTKLPVGGVGTVAVDLLHKKEHVAKEMLTYFLRHYKDRGCKMLALYAFRPDFYGLMGFGLATKMSQYRVKPCDLPKGPSKGHVRELTAEDRPLLQACYQRVAERTHGMFDKTENELNRMFANATLQRVGVEQDGQLTGYLTFVFKKGAEDNFLLNDIQVQELVYETPEALSELMTFLHAQADQIRHVVINTQDEFFHYLPQDARYAPGSRMIPSVYHESHHSGIGLMFRVLDVRGLLEELAERDREYAGPDLRVKLTIQDTFFPENDGSVLVQVQDGRMQVVAEGEAEGEADVEVALDIADFSSWVLGAVTLKALYRYSRAKVSDPACLSALHALFAFEEKPICLTAF
ncbi:MAG TPA: GNAT family N-acetyltransferase [Bacilli bacterium]|nr:GNAT family N-acetyltransferase [Bacilli bacterium]